MVGNLGTRIAAIEGFSPNQGRGLNGDPLVIAGPGQYTFNGHMLGQRQAGEFVFDFAGAVPDLDVLGEIVEGQQVRIRTMNPGHQDMRPIGRNVHS